MKLIDRYMSAVSFYLPARRRDEITRELRANILDKLENLAEQRGWAVTEQDVSAVLKELGHPQQIANSFLPAQQLVTAELFPFYRQVLGYGVIFNKNCVYPTTVRCLHGTKFACGRRIGNGKVFSGLYIEHINIICARVVSRIINFISVIGK